MKTLVNIVKQVSALMLSVLVFMGTAKAADADSITVYVFLSETCPICQTSTIDLNQLYNTYKTKGIKFVGVFPNTGMSTESSINKFARKYHLDFEMQLDAGHRLVNQLNATATPQVFVVRNADNSILYQGKIDNHFEALGKRREVVTEKYLNSSLENILNHKPIAPAETKPVGCFIINN